MPADRPTLGAECAALVSQVYPDLDRIPEDDLRLTENGIAELEDHFNELIDRRDRERAPKPDEYCGWNESPPEMQAALKQAHERLWWFVRRDRPGASGKLPDYLADYDFTQSPQPGAATVKEFLHEFWEKWGQCVGVDDRFVMHDDLVIAFRAFAARVREEATKDWQAQTKGSMRIAKAEALREEAVAFNVCSFLRQKDIERVQKWLERKADALEKDGPGAGEKRYSLKELREMFFPKDTEDLTAEQLAKHALEEMKKVLDGAGEGTT